MMGRPAVSGSEPREGMAQVMDANTFKPGTATQTALAWTDELDGAVPRLGRSSPCFAPMCAVILA